MKSEILELLIPVPSRSFSRSVISYFIIKANLHELTNVYSIQTMGELIIFLTDRIQEVSHDFINSCHIRKLFFQGPIRRDIKPTVKIRNILFATFKPHLPATSLHSRRSDVGIFRSVVPTFQYPRHRSQPPVLSANSLRWSAAHFAKMLSSFGRIMRGKR